MPFAKIKAAFIGTGVSIHYELSTPTSSTAKAIDPKLPTLIFLHGVYIASAVFHTQFSDHVLRRHNLIALDSRSHGSTVGGCGKKWSVSEAAEDVNKVMEYLKIPVAHIVGLSMGAAIATVFASMYPKRAASLFLISPPPLVEPDDVLEGRQQIADYWMAGFGAGKNDPTDEDALVDAVYGAVQLGFNGKDSSLIAALTKLSVPHGMKNWGPSRFDDFQNATVGFFRYPRPRREVIAEVKCGVTIVHCADDIAYQFEETELVVQTFRDAQVDVRLEKSVPGAPHYGHVTHPDIINPLIAEHVARYTKLTLGPIPETIVSPFEDALKSFGYVPDESEDSDDDYM